MEGESDEVVWSKDSVVKVIELYRERPVLWDATSNLYKDKNKKHYAWQEIANEMNTSKLEVKNKIRNLTIQFKREMKKPKSGSGADPYKKKWFALDYLMFLKDTTTPRHCRESTDPNTSDSIPEVRKQTKCLFIFYYVSHINIEKVTEYYSFVITLA